MSVPKPPKGYAVAQLDGIHWYALRIELHYSIHSPDGQMSISGPLINPQNLQDAPCKRRDDAIQLCVQWVIQEAAIEQRYWLRLALHAEHDTDRVLHCLDVLEEATGKTPYVSPPWMHETYGEVYVPGYQCFSCDGQHYGFIIQAPTVEEALIQAAERAYAEHMTCVRTVSVRAPRREGVYV